MADTLYGAGRAPLFGFKRLALHALSLNLMHPNGETMQFSAPLPQDFVEAEKALTTK